MSKLTNQVCELRETADEIVKLDYCYERISIPWNKSRWYALFGSPERAARTICRQLKHFTICICDGCPVKPPNKECDSEYDALLEWLRGDA